MFVFREKFNHTIKKVSETKHIDAADADWIPETQFIKLIQVFIQVQVVHFVDNKQNWFFRFAQNVCDVLVIFCQSVSCIGKEADNIRKIHGNFSLLSHLAQQDVVAFRINTACIDQCEMMAQPFSISGNPVPGNTGHIIHYTDSLACHFIEECGFSDIRPADDCNERFSHFLPPIPTMRG